MEDKDIEFMNKISTKITNSTVKQYPYLSMQDIAGIQKINSKYNPIDLPDLSTFPSLYRYLFNCVSDKSPPVIRKSTADDINYIIKIYF